MEIAKVTSKGQITIPIEVRKLLDLSPGDKVVFLSVGNEVVIRKVDSLDFDLATISPIGNRKVAEQSAEYDPASDAIKSNGEFQ